MGTKNALPKTIKFRRQKTVVKFTIEIKKKTRSSVWPDILAKI
jgi:hypothetical protein